jgi:hypothetical protein
VAHIEIEQFALAPGVTRDSFSVLDDRLQAWSYVHRAGLRRRTTAFGDDGTVLVVTIFSGATSPPPLVLDTAAGVTRDDDAVDGLRGAIKPGSYRRNVFEDRG